jgi:predicted metalloprotease
MLWRGGRRSSNIEDRRGGGGFSGGLGGGFGGGGRIGGGGVKVGGLGIVVILLVGYFFGVDPSALLSQIEGGGMGGVGYEQPAGSQPIPEDDEAAQFVSVVLADTEDTWSEIFKAAGETYQAPRLVLFRGRTSTACGTGAAAMGPFYCPGDSKVYIDLSFYDELKQRFQAPGDFAQAYVIAHEVGHHIQHLIGSTEEIGRAFGGNETGADSASVRIELQADCFAGVWAYHANQRKIVEPGDVDEALNAASAIGDDKLQEEGQGYVVPDSFTHGTSAQRVRWFKRGMENGDVNACDTLNAKTL